MSRLADAKTLVDIADTVLKMWHTVLDRREKRRKEEEEREREVGELRAEVERLKGNKEPIPR